MRQFLCSCKQNIFSLHAGMSSDSQAKDWVVDIHQDYNAVVKWAMTAHLRAAVHMSFKDICKKQKTRKEKELSKKSITDSEEQVLKIIAVISSTRKSKLKKILFQEKLQTQNISKTY